MFPHSRSMCTGTTGTLEAAREGLQRWARSAANHRRASVRIPQTGTPVRPSANGPAQPGERAPSPPAAVGGGNGNRSHSPGQPVNGRRAHKTAAALRKQMGRPTFAPSRKGSMKTDVVANQQRGPAGGQVFLPAYFNSIKRVGQQPKAQANDATREKHGALGKR